MTKWIRPIYQRQSLHASGLTAEVCNRISASRTGLLLISLHPSSTHRLSHPHQPLFCTPRLFRLQYPVGKLQVLSDQFLLFVCRRAQLSDNRITRFRLPFRSFLRQHSSNDSCMKRTLLAVGIAVILSMMLMPRADTYGVHIWLPFFYDTQWMGYKARNLEIHWSGFILQTVFAAVLFAVLVNLWPRRRR
jgi:hypothetical protein